MDFDFTAIMGREMLCARLEEVYRFSYFRVAPAHPILRVGNLQALRVASKTLPCFMRDFATRTEVEAILRALAVSFAWFGLSFCNVGGVGWSFCLACVCASTVRALRVTQKMVGPEVADILN